MNIKKQLKEERLKIDEKILADGEETYNELAEQYCVAKSEQKQPKRTSLRKSFAMASFVFALCLIVGLSVAFTTSPYDPSIPEYYYKNERSADCTLAEFNSATDGKIEFAKNDAVPNVTSFSRVYDSKTSDTLYYRVGFEREQNSLSGNLYVIVNKYYEYPENFIGEIIKGHSINKNYLYVYTVKETVIDNVRTYEYTGHIMFNDNDIYFTFEESREVSQGGDCAIDTPIAADLFFEEFLLLT